MGDALEIPNEDSGEEITSIVDKPNEKTEESESQVGSKQVSEKDRKGARTMWAALHQEWTPELTKRDIIFRSKLNAKEVNRLLPKYFSVEKHKNGKYYYKWGPDYEVPAIDGPNQPLFEEGEPKDPKDEGQTYQPSLPKFYEKKPAGGSEENN